MSLHLNIHVITPLLNMKLRVMFTYAFFQPVGGLFKYRATRKPA